ncbi:MAG: DUF1080 domain-containing protein [Phycisphaerae bacterium]|nr:DUF1080 domain-containing protein [Phycisphaerae bacterium]
MKKFTFGAILFGATISLVLMMSPAYGGLNEPPKGFRALFNGEDLSGWKGLVENPKTRVKMKKEELAGKQAKADADMRAHWKVEDGALVFDGKGHSLCTDKDYGDFEMLVDWKIEKGGDSGIYLRGSPQVQIWDTARVGSGAQVGSGGLYNNQKNPSKPSKVADKPVGQWNTFRLKMHGERVTVHLNGVLVVDNVVMENYWERDKPIYPNGQIELQSHGSKLYFRNVYIREIKNKLTKQEKDDGFRLLFKGDKEKAGWQGNMKGYVVRDGMIIVEPTLGGGNLYTAQEYGDFIMRFEFKLTPGANNGLGIRAPLQGDPAYAGMELQILDNTSPKYKNLQDYQYHGSVYGVVPADKAKRNVLKAGTAWDSDDWISGGWNYQEVTAKGNKITVKLNGETIVDKDIKEASTPQTMDKRNHPGLLNKKGYIAFCGHGDKLAFRNLRIKELD